jgi:hypothetical protein
MTTIKTHSEIRDELSKTTDEGKIELHEQELGRVTGSGARKAGGTPVEYLKIKLSEVFWAAANRNLNQRQRTETNMTIKTAQNQTPAAAGTNNLQALTDGELDRVAGGNDRATTVRFSELHITKVVDW